MRIIRKNPSRKGQSVIELMLVLPIFLLMLFFLLEIANIAYHTILVNHTAHELARIGSLTVYTTQTAPADKRRMRNAVRNALVKMYPEMAPHIVTHVSLDRTGVDPQSGAQMSDTVVKIIFPIQLVFPGSSLFLADKPKEKGIKKIMVEARMPAEQPLMYSI